MNYTLTVIVNNTDIPALKAAGYKLCIARKVNNSYNVIWKGSEFFYRNKFAWSTKFEVFGTKEYDDGARVEADTDCVSIQSGLTATLDEDGVMNSPTGTPDESGTFYVNNAYGTMAIGVNGCLAGDKFSAIYVSPNLVSGTVDLTPKEAVMVWFDSQRTTKTIILHAVTDSIDVDYTGRPNNQTITYASDPDHPGRGGWIQNNQYMPSATYDPRANRFTIEPPSMEMLAKMTHILATQSTATAAPYVKATAEFEEAAAEEFAKHAKASRVEGVSGWDVSVEGSKVEVQITPDDEDRYGPAAVSVCQDAFLRVWYGFEGPAYQKLSFEVMN